MDMALAPISSLTFAALLCGMLFLEQTLGHKYAIVLEYNANKQISRDSSKRLSDTKRIQRYCRTEPVIFLLKFSRSLAFAPSPNHPPLTRLFHAGLRKPGQPIRKPDEKFI
jgi:hypothetical protein